MASWNHLPMEIGYKIVKELDFRTRFRFRHVSKSSQILIDSVSLFIPQVSLLAKSETELKLTFYLGIENYINVEILKHGKGKVSVKVTETNGNDELEHGALRIVDHQNAAKLALAAFRTVTMHPKTLCGCIELLSTEHIPVELSTDPRTLPVIRTKLLILDRKLAAVFLIGYSRAELEEIRVINLPDDWSYDDYDDPPARYPYVMTYTRRMSVRADSEDVREVMFDNCYALSDMDLTGIIIRNFVMAREIGDRRTIFLSDRWTAMHCLFKVTTCGVIYRKTTKKVEEELDPCKMRWACSKCADPFEHWYFTKMLSTAGAKFHWIPRGFREREIGYMELVSPIVNGVDPVEELLDNYQRLYTIKCSETATEQQKTETEVEKEITKSEKQLRKKRTVLSKIWPFLMLYAFFCVGILCFFIVYFV